MSSFSSCAVAFLAVVSAIGVSGQSTTTVSTTVAATTISTTVSATTSASATPTPLNGTSAYVYLGCYNETTGYNETGNLRAVTHGDHHDSDTMTARDCISHCGSNVYAGLEYGRECWCGDYLSTLSQMLPESNCSMPCTGNANQSCGGRLTITLYTKKAEAKSAADGITGYRSLATAFVLVSSIAFAGFLST